jgi:CubicO group peptidase (beta-lactamase class C family)/D-alanyl-D-alanine dipeptidase
MPHRLLLATLLLGACTTTAPDHPALQPVADDLTPYVDRQLREMGIPGACIAVLDVDPKTGEERLLTRAFGTLTPSGGAMRADAIHRVASISKLYTATAAMVLVERGVLDLDAPVTTYLPDFAPRTTHATPITLRHLLGHRAGVVREAPIGHYFDPTAPTLAATVASLNDTELVHTPGAKFKYSNPGIGVVGEVVARVTGKSFEDAIRDLVLTPLALHDSDFAPRADLVARAADGVMWTYDGRTIPTPTWPFGYGPAANLRSSVVDLVRFARSWMPDAKRRVVSPATQAAMWTLPEGTSRGCGLGFFVAELDGQRRVGHDGAVYGFASALRALPDAGLAVAVVCTKDFGNDVSEAIADRALRAALAARRGETLPAATFPTPIGAEVARALAGRYHSGPNRVELLARGDELHLDPSRGQRTRMRRDPTTDAALVADDVLGIGAPRWTIRDDGTFHDGRTTFVRDETPPAEPPAELLPLLGEYGWDHNVLVVYEDHGRLATLIEWVVRDIPTREAADRYRYASGMYGGDQLVFERDERGRVVAAVLGGARFPRRPDPDPDFRITPTGDVAALRAAAMRATPPSQPDGLRPFDLVDLTTLDPTLKFDVRYATTNNFLGTKVYERAIAKLQRPAADALLRVHRSLAAAGLGLCVFDAYRPWFVTKVFADATPASMQHFVADPSQGSRHNRGCAVDLTLYDRATGEVLAMPSGFDEFTERAYPDYPGGTSRQRHFREVLRRAMEAEGFTVYEHEWWHFDFRDWRHYGIGNEPL